MPTRAGPGYTIRPLQPADIAATRAHIVRVLDEDLGSGYRLWVAVDTSTADVVGTIALKAVGAHGGVVVDGKADPGKDPQRYVLESGREQPTQVPIVVLRPAGNFQRSSVAVRRSRSRRGYPGRKGWPPITRSSVQTSSPSPSNKLLTRPNDR
jgi:hypothetical protein